MLYMMNGVVYHKENLKNKAAIPTAGRVNRNNFTEMDEKFEAVNGFRENVENNFINIVFDEHPDPEIYSYRLSFYDHIDGFDSDEQNNEPEYEKVIVDSFTQVDDITLK